MDPVWKRLIAGDNGIAPIRHFDVAMYRTKVAAEIRDVDGYCPAEIDSYGAPSPLPDLEPLEIRRSASVFLACAQDAFADSGLASVAGLDRTRCGVAAGTSVACSDHAATEAYYMCRTADGKQVDVPRFDTASHQPKHVFLRRFGEMPAVLAAKVLGLRGPSIAMDTACAASGHAIGEAFRAVQDGRALAMVCGGATAVVSPIGILYFGVLGALSPNPDPQTASRPFDKNRDGFVMGEGGGAIVIEDYEHAVARGARIYAELAGFGANTCAFNLTDPSPDGSVEAAAIRLALADAGASTDEVGYVAAHGTSTQKNDLAETRAIRTVFGHRVPVSSVKGQLGHTLTGAAVTNLIAATLALGEGILPPTMHLQTPDPELDLDYVPGAARSSEITCAVVNSFAFGGQNAVLVVRKS